MAARQPAAVRAVAGGREKRVSTAAALSTQHSALGPACAVCNDTGWKIAGEGARATPCECRQAESARRLLAQAAIPQRYRAAEFENFEIVSGAIEAAKFRAQMYAEQWPFADHVADQQPRSLLLIGTVGTGKTHLAVAILKRLLGRGIAGRFHDYCGLLKEIQNCYNPDSQAAELDLLRPAFDTEVIVLDDLGAMRPSSWALDTVTLLLNTRYNRRKTTILTTNFPDRDAAAFGCGGRRAGEPVRFQDSLADRVGERVVSRLREMCRFVTMEGADFRATMHGRGAA